MTVSVSALSNPRQIRCHARAGAPAQDKPGRFINLSDDK
ncbi:hypothetical protein BH24ACT8_BH24ACT8_11330 [soil metagenome]